MASIRYAPQLSQYLLPQHYQERALNRLRKERVRQKSRRPHRDKFVPQNLDWIAQNVLPDTSVSYNLQLGSERFGLDPEGNPLGLNPFEKGERGEILPLGLGGRTRRFKSYWPSKEQIGADPLVWKEGQVEVHESLHVAEKVLWDNPEYWKDVTFINPDTGEEEKLIELLIHHDPTQIGPSGPKPIWQRKAFHDAIYWSSDQRTDGRIFNLRGGSEERAEALTKALDEAAGNIRAAWESGALSPSNYMASKHPNLGFSEAQSETGIDPLAQPYKPGFWAVDYDPTQARWQETESELGGYGVDVRAQPEKIGGTGYQQWDVGADYVPDISAVMPDIRSRDLYTPPGPPGEAAFRQSQAVPSTLQAGLLSQPVTTGLIEQPDTGVILEQSTYDYDRAQREAEVQDAIRREQIKAPQPQVASMPEIMPQGYGESIGLLPPQGYGESIGVMPPQGYGESIGVLPPRGYGESIGSLNPIDYPQAVARLGLNYATEPVQLPSTTFSNFRATGPEPLYGRGGLPPSVFPQIEVDRGTEGLTIPSERPEIKTRPEIPETGWDEWIKERVEKELDNGGFLSKAGGILGKGLVSMISKAKADVQDQGLLAEKDRKAEIAEQKLEAKRKSKVELYQASILKKPESKYLINEGVNNLKIINSWGKRTNFEKGLVSVGEYNLDTDTKKQLTTSKLPWYADRAYLTADAAEEFELMRDAYGKDIPLESAYRNKDHNDALAILYGEAVKSSKHMDGLSIDVPSGAARDWMLLNGKKYGWELAVYKKKDGTMNKNHFNFVGGGP